MAASTNNKIYAYIDGANLHRGISALGWQLDYARFRVWLKDKYHINRAYLFIGLIPKYKALYTFLQECGYTLIFKETTYDHHGKAKGNCDADLVVQAMSDVFEDGISGVALVTGDGDFAALAKFLIDKNKLLGILAPDNEKCSILLKRTNAPIIYLKELKSILAIMPENEKAPGKDEPRKGLFRSD
jgi:uncharacterized LabA/DUF88 family protein